MIDMRFAPLALLAAGTFAAPAAAVTTVSFNFDPYASDDQTSIDLSFGDSGTTQFLYGRDSETGGAKVTNFGSARTGEFVDSYRLPNSHDVIDRNGAKIAPGGGEQYLLLSFYIDDVQQAGTAKFTGLTLDEVKYDLAPSVVPEPAVWAQLIAGFGLAGGALRVGRRRRSTVNA